MFFFRHPKSLVDPRPVAELSVQAPRSALPTLEPYARTQAGPVQELPTDRIVAAPIDRSADERRIDFSVRYGFREYCSIVEDHLPAALVEMGKVAKRPGLGSRLLLRAVLAPLFVYKKWRVGTCRFVIDGQGLTRLSKGRAVTIPWSDVVAVHRYRNGYLVAIAQGAMPLPYRCFKAWEREIFDTWAKAD